MKMIKSDNCPESRASHHGPTAVAAVAAFVLASALLLSACASNENTNDTTNTVSGNLSGTLNAGGSTAQTAAQDAWRAGFQAANSSVTVNYDPVGSGAGRSGFESGSYAVAGTDDAFGTDEISSATFSLCASNAIVEVPVYVSPIAFAFNLSGVGTLTLDASTAAKMMTGAIKTWNDPAITALNPGATLPSTAISPVYRSDKSGTTGNVTDYLSKAAGSAWTYGLVENWPTDLAAGEGAQGTQGVVTTIQGAQGTFGYVDASQTKGLGVVSLINSGSPVAPTAAAASKTLSASSMQTGRGTGDLAFTVNRTPSDSAAYPMIMVSYEVGCQQYKDASIGTLAKAYMAYIVTDAAQQAAASNAGSAPLTADSDLATKVATAVDSIS